MKTAIVFSASSDIGFELCIKLISKNYSIIGTYKTYSRNVKKLDSLGVKLYKCNLLYDDEIEKILKNIKKDITTWDSLFLLQATMNPIGKLEFIDMNEWEDSIKLNFINQIKIIKELLIYRTKKSAASVITFAGGGTNNATEKFSAYTISKLSLIKMMELLYAEYPDTKFTCIGPGWIKTKIHNETINAKNNAIDAYNKTLETFENNNFTEMKKVIDCIIWILNTDKKYVSGRNFSVTNDEWDTPKLNKELEKNNHMYKLRREGNLWNK